MQIRGARGVRGESPQQPSNTRYWEVAHVARISGAPACAGDVCVRPTSAPLPQSEAVRGACGESLPSSPATLVTGRSRALPGLAAPQLVQGMSASDRRPRRSLSLKQCEGHAGRVSLADQQHSLLGGRGRCQD